MAEQSTTTGPTAAVRQKLLEAMLGFWSAQAAYVAAKLHIADHLADGPKSGGELAGMTGANPPALGRLMRALTALGVCEQREGGLFALGTAGEYLRMGVPGSLRHVAMHFGGQLWPLWGELLHSVTTGEAPGKRFFESLSRDPEAAEIFNQAMVEFTELVGAAVVRAYDFSPICTLVDVGGGCGALAAAILRANPHMRGKVLDMQHAAKAANEYFNKAGVAGRCEFVEGNFFESVPAGADAYILKSVIHDWDGERAAEILKTCRRAMTPDAKLLVVERLMPERLESSEQHRAAAFFDLNMLVATGGMERTEAEFERLFRRSGFRLARLVPADARGFQVIEGSCA